MIVSVKVPSYMWVLPQEGLSSFIMQSATSFSFASLNASFAPFCVLLGAVAAYAAHHLIACTLTIGTWGRKTAEHFGTYRYQSALFFPFKELWVQTRRIAVIIVAMPAEKATAYKYFLFAHIYRLSASGVIRNRELLSKLALLVAKYKTRSLIYLSYFEKLHTACVGVDKVRNPRYAEVNCTVAYCNCF